jgi:hypothetical protein
VAVWLRDAMCDGMGPLLDPVPVEVEVNAGGTRVARDIGDTYHVVTVGPAVPEYYPRCPGKR